MAPGTLHAVMTTHDSFSVGGMIHLPTMFDKTLSTINLLHFAGQQISNSDYPGGHLMFFHLIGYYARILRTDGFLEARTTEEKMAAEERTVLNSGIAGSQKPADIYWSLAQST